MKATLDLVAAISLALGVMSAIGQNWPAMDGNGPASLMEKGYVLVDAKSTPYLIRRLPVTSYPELPSRVAEELSRRKCAIPQTYEAHHPENVVHASLARAGSSDWAVLCSVQGTVSLLVFLEGDSVTEPVALASVPETKRLQGHDASGVLGFNWGIDPATPQQVHDAQNGLSPRPSRVDHDALADSTLERRTIYHFYGKDSWSVLQMPN